MIARLSLLALSLALVAGQPLLAKDKVKSDPSGEVVSCEGVYGRLSSEALVKETFGAENVETGMVYGPEGIEMLATTVYADDPERTMQFGWWDEEKREYPSYVDLSPSQASPQGVKLGMSVAEVEAINGAPFTVGGFWWDYGGNGIIEEGALANPDAGCGTYIRFAPSEDYPEDLDVTAVSGEVTVPSSEPLLEQLDVRVQTLSIGYPWPEELPQPEY